MKLTSQTSYAIRMLMYCHSKGELATVKEVAKFYGLPERFLFKILLNLNAAGYMETVRGRHGGIRLARPAAQIRLGDVVRDIEENFELAECFQSEGTNCPLVTSCGMNEALNRALLGFFDILNEYTIADLVRNNHNINVLMQLNKAKSLPLDA